MTNVDSDFERGKKLFQNESYKEAFCLLMPYAKQGNAEAQANVGFMFYAGLGTDRNLHEAIMWLTKAANNGRGEAAHNLATLYLTCEPDMPRNATESKKWYLKAREMGFIVAADDWYEKINQDQ